MSVLHLEFRFICICWLFLSAFKSCRNKENTRIWLRKHCLFAVLNKSFRWIILFRLYKRIFIDAHFSTFVWNKLNLKLWTHFIFNINLHKKFCFWSTVQTELKRSSYADSLMQCGNNQRFLFLQPFLLTFSCTRLIFYQLQDHCHAHVSQVQTNTHTVQQKDG